MDLRQSQTLPPGYTLRANFSMKNKNTLLLMNLAGVVGLIFSGWFFSAAALAVQPAAQVSLLSVRINGLDALWTVAAVLGVMALVILVHEAIHGVGFWLLCGVRPTFAFRGAYAYAAAPGWYLPRDRYLLTGLAPLVLISLVCLGLFIVVPAGWVFPLVLAAVLNASGAVGDIWVAVLLLRQPRQALAIDEGDQVSIFAPDVQA